ncbi:MAG TPA: hypothetical protein ENK18_17995 [Deltaproteobacteria bacterium]|nr:hypothetical protein [Deltaproteobacteria bacterium]
MKRLWFACSVVLAVGLACSGGTEDGAPDGGDGAKDKIVVVPVPEGEDKEHWCCEYVDEEEQKRFALTDGPGDCNSAFEDRDGRWVSGTQCTPCCCEAPSDPEDEDSELALELTTPSECAGVGECVPLDKDGACGEDEGGEDGGGEDGGGEEANPRPRPRPRPRPVAPRKPVPKERKLIRQPK